MLELLKSKDVLLFDFKLNIFGFGLMVRQNI